jgi:2-oxoglutarate dehydrogenase E2 component (dihydrolipoamide succinyltransferase)
MSKIKVILPQMGEGIIEATITRWLTNINIFIEEDEPFVEIATDKVDTEIPSPVSGILLKHFYNEGEIAKVGDVIAIIDDGKEEEFTQSTNKKSSSLPLVKKKHSDLHTNKSKEVVNEYSLNSKIVSRKTNIPPFIRHFSKTRGISNEELIQLESSVGGEQLLKEDIIKYIKEGRIFRNSEVVNKQDVSVQDYILKEGEELVELDRTRNLIAQHMVRSVKIAPHVTSFVEADITPLVTWREAIKEKFKKEYGISLTFTPIIVEIVVQALKEYTGINASLISENKMVIKKYINIGIATALPDGNLIVPVIKNADRYNLTKLAQEINEKSSRARQGKLLPGETGGGTFTITNLGQVGNISGTPIINQPESAILAVGAIKKKPGVVKVNDEFTIGVRDILTLSLSYDHRIIDGAMGGAFLARIGELLENYIPTLSV